MNQNKITLPVAVAALFLILAVGGSIVTSAHMNRTADEHQMSAGRAGDARQNRVNDQDAASARGATTGNKPDTNVPPSHK